MSWLDGWAGTNECLAYHRWAIFIQWRDRNIFNGNSMHCVMFYKWCCTLNVSRLSFPLKVPLVRDNIEGVWLRDTTSIIHHFETKYPDKVRSAMKLSFLKAIK